MSYACFCVCLVWVQQLFTCVFSVNIPVSILSILFGGAGIAQWLERRTRDLPIYFSIIGSARYTLEDNFAITSCGGEGAQQNTNKITGATIPKNYRNLSEKRVASLGTVLSKRECLIMFSVCGSHAHTT